ncbi:MAG: hypothetical protein MHM6MM_000197 [Cercozoa sp. M6MM]
MPIRPLDTGDFETKTLASLSPRRTFSVLKSPTAELLFWRKTLKKLKLYPAHANPAATLFHRLVIAPLSNFAILASFDYQLWLFETFHVRRISRYTHFVALPIACLLSYVGLLQALRADTLGYGALVEQVCNILLATWWLLPALALRSGTLFVYLAVFVATWRYAALSLLDRVEHPFAVAFCGGAAAAISHSWEKRFPPRFVSRETWVTLAEIRASFGSFQLVYQTFLQLTFGSFAEWLASARLVPLIAVIAFINLRELRRDAIDQKKKTPRERQVPRSLVIPKTRFGWHARRQSFSKESPLSPLSQLQHVRKVASIALETNHPAVDFVGLGGGKALSTPPAHTRSGSLSAVEPTFEFAPTLQRSDEIDIVASDED